MRLGQIKADGGYLAAVFERGLARAVPGYTVVDLIRRSEVQGVSLIKTTARLASHHAESHPPALPIVPPEVWACGCTYERSASFRDAEHGAREGMYAYVYNQPRPEVFFKGTARVCVGSGQAIGIRADSRFTAPEPELALVLGSKGNILGYTLANDVSAWDIERENALYLPQSKIYTACCALGPVIVTAEDLPDPYNLEMNCTITRDGQPRFSGSVSTAKLHRKFETLIEYLRRANPTPAGTVLLTGTGIIVPEDAALAPGDVVTISIPEIGELTNHAQTVGAH
ncbi:MAG TPA: fumarylacetoacetate hydrolase family protein [Bryobacteraceae bacterium]|jgi:2-dehydro-3-deoxy-D-arabinonate dehydratase|nr:fumarylacetoacetate hydrolase family protein [Bryobacteraceae bacterium]